MYMGLGDGAGQAIGPVVLADGVVVGAVVAGEEVVEVTEVAVTEVVVTDLAVTDLAVALVGVAVTEAAVTVVKDQEMHLLADLPLVSATTDTPYKLPRSRLGDY